MRRAPAHRESVGGDPVDHQPEPDAPRLAELPRVREPPDRRVAHASVAAAASDRTPAAVSIARASRRAPSTICARSMPV